MADPVRSDADMLILIRSGVILWYLSFRANLGAANENAQTGTGIKENLID